MASLFSEIRNDILNPESNITDILRKCAVLAYKINNDVFIKWTELELEGYDDSDVLPDYRIVGTVIRGDFTDGFRVSAPGMAIDKHLVPDYLQDSFGSGRLYYPASYLESLLLYSGDEDPRRDMPMAALHNFKNLYGDLYCIKAYEILPRMGCYSVVDSIKNKILKFLLEIEKKIENVEDIKLSKEDEKTITQTFTNNIYGNANIANASENFNQSIQSQSDELINKLVTELVQLKGQGTDTNIIDAVIPHIEEIKHIKNQKGVMDKVASIMTIAGGSASVCTLIAPYIPMLSNLFG
ncbi:hypothetical protein ISO71_17200 [Morganella morganii subsp. morganii]|uniref:AbiTii domain-containing protein n=3 Tax=Morganella morganii TaxID=582 RepID=UPI0006628C76|nr:hypothetical protein [Morganella morganii]AVD60298.1 hypothetical protein C4E49_13250 [Morganella morganii]MBT0429707.1 hypothetical protein [Morganella morganii subsp. morganii]MBT0477365.1 hypothetical protein [Morganella morganii subsp. morganii]MBT0524444.1 hypothetical protein [Morganella morganii subsp. morganii]MCW3199552.1 hypothetical protein [Morganella morganii]